MVTDYLHTIPTVQRSIQVFRFDSGWLFLCLPHVTTQDEALFFFQLLDDICRDAGRFRVRNETTAAISGL